MSKWLPKSILCLQSYTKRLFVGDLMAGITVGFVALPLSMSLSSASGVPPQDGLYCAIVAGFVISALGGSKTQIGGPTGAFVVVVFGIVARYGVDGLFMCTLMAGVLLLMLGVTGLGTAVKFMPRPVVVGFTNGIAVFIASTQIKDFFGLKVEHVPGEFWARLETLARNFGTISYTETLLGIWALIVIIFCVRRLPKVPGYIVALFVGTALVWVLKLPVETIGTRFGGIPSGLPTLNIPSFHFSHLRPLIGPAITVAMLGAIESLMSAVVSDRMSGDRHNPNVELIAQGIANIVSPLFGGLPATGAIARTATNIRSGARTPVAGMAHALTLLSILLFAAPMAQYIPLAVLSAILMVVSYNMGEWREIPRILKMTWADISVWLATFTLTVFADLTVAVEAGMIMGALVFISKVTRTTKISRVTRDYVEHGRRHILQDKEIPPYVAIFRIHGPFLFGAAAKMETVIQKLPELPPVLILWLRNMTAIDATGLQKLEHFADVVHGAHKALLLCGALEQPAQLMKQAEFEEHVGKYNICGSIEDALERAREVYEEMCATLLAEPDHGQKTDELAEQRHDL